MAAATKSSSKSYKTLRVETHFRENPKEKRLKKSQLKTVVVCDEDDVEVDKFEGKCVPTEAADDSSTLSDKDTVYAAHKELQHALSACIGQKINCDSSSRGSESNTNSTTEVDQEDFACKRKDTTNITNITLEDSILEHLLEQRISPRFPQTDKPIQPSAKIEGEAYNENSSISDQANNEKDPSRVLQDVTSMNHVPLGKEKHTMVDKEVFGTSERSNTTIYADGSIRKSDTETNELPLGAESDASADVNEKTTNVDCNIVATDGSGMVEQPQSSSQKVCLKSVLKHGVDMFQSHKKAPMNDVISEVFKTGERQKAWELMKTKQCALQRKKVVYPVVVIKNDDDTKEKTEEHAEKEDLPVPEPPAIISPLTQFQLSLESQIRDLVTTLQNFHSVEKDVIVQTLKSEQQAASKESLDVLHQILRENSDVKGASNNKSIAIQTQSEKKQVNKLSPQKPKKTCNKAVKTTKNPSTLPCAKHPSSSEPNKEVLVQQPISRKSGSVILKKITPPVSILKTPVRRRKAPLPFTEQCLPNIPPPQVHQPPASSCALLHEILKDTSASSMLNDISSPLTSHVKDNPHADSSGNTSLGHTTAGEILGGKEGILSQCEEQTTTSVAVPVLDIESEMTSTPNENEEVLASVPAASVPENEGDLLVVAERDSEKVNLKSQNEESERQCVRFVVEPENMSDLPDAEAENSVDTISSLSTLNGDTNSSFLNENVLDKFSLPPKLQPLNPASYQLEVSQKLTLDERIHALRKNFINSGNEWLYKPKLSSGISVEDAKKVLREAKATSRILADDNFLKYKDPNDLYSYFEANPHLVDCEVVRLKKGVDQNIRSLDSVVEKNVKKKTKKRKQKRVPLQERNTFV